MKRLLRNVFTVLICSAASLANATEIGYYRQPALANDSVVFVAEGDLWRVGLAGGTAVRLTTNAAAESHPAVSADGKWLAFTGRFEGPAEVYIMPIQGGAPKRQSFDGDTALVQGFTADGRVLYSTLRYSGKPETRLYAIDPTNANTSAIPLHQAAEGCYLGANLFFARQPLQSDNVKRYQGGQAQKIWRFDGTNEATPLTHDFAGTSRQPMCGNGRVYFISDRDGSHNIWSMAGDGRGLLQHTRHTDFDIRSASISPDGKRIAYQRAGDINLVTVATNTTTTLAITLQSDFEQTRSRWVKNPWDFVSAVAPSPTGDRVLITARGQLFVAPVGNGRLVEASRASDFRAREGVFSHDGKAAYAFADKSGEMELWRFAANGVGNATQLTKNGTVLRLKAIPSPDGKWIAHFDKDRRLYLLNLATNEDKRIDVSAVDVYDDIAWSPDSRWISFNKAAENNFEALHLFEVASGKQSQITSDRYHARSSTFSADGKWLFFLGSRNLRSVVTSPWGQRNPEPFFDRQTKIYALALDPAARWPFLPKDELQKPDAKPEPPAASGEAKPAAKEAPKTDAVKPIVLTLAGLSERLYEVPVAAGNYSSLSTDGKRLYFLVTEATVERKNALRSVAIEAPNPAPPVVEAFFEDVRSYMLTQDKKRLLVRRANDLFMFDVGKAAPALPEQAKFAVNLRDWTIAVSPREEWQQIFVDAWRMHRDFFYDKNMHGVDWPKVRAKYQPLLARVSDRAEVDDVVMQMSAEVAALHSQVGAADLRKPTDTIDVAGLAADVVKTPQGFRITALFGGDPELLEERSPLNLSEVNVAVGETLTAVNGVAATAAASLGELLRNQSGKQVLLAVTDASGKAREVVVTPVTARRDRELRYLAWERARMLRTETASDTKIGYVHLQAMGGNDIARWAREFYPVFQREGLIIDLRHNAGGSIDSWIIEKLQRRAWHFWQSRQSDRLFWNQQLAFRGHVVAIIDADTYSDGETMAQGLRRLGIATLVGKTTAGAGIWLSDRNRLLDNGIARAAETGSFVDDGRGVREWITEGVGVKPDIDVDNLPHATFKGSDAQLDAAIRYLQERMVKEPMKLPLVPGFPVVGR